MLGHGAGISYTGPVPERAPLKIPVWSRGRPGYGRRHHGSWGNNIPSPYEGEGDRRASTQVTKSIAFNAEFIL